MISRLARTQLSTNWQDFDLFGDMLPDICKFPLKFSQQLSSSLTVGQQSVKNVQQSTHCGPEI